MTESPHLNTSVRLSDMLNLNERISFSLPDKQTGDACLSASAKIAVAKLQVFLGGACLAVTPRFTFAAQGGKLNLHSLRIGSWVGNPDFQTQTIQTACNLLQSRMGAGADVARTHEVSPEQLQDIIEKLPAPDQEHHR